MNLLTLLKSFLLGLKAYFLLMKKKYLKNFHLEREEFRNQKKQNLLKIVTDGLQEYLQYLQYFQLKKYSLSSHYLHHNMDF